MHAELRSTDVNGLDSGLGGDHWPDGGATSAILLDDEVLKRNGRIRSLSQNAGQGGAHRVSGVSLISIDLENNALVDFRLVRTLMLLRVVRMDGVCHVSADEETASNGSVVVFARHSGGSRDDSLEDAFGSLD